MKVIMSIIVKQFLRGNYRYGKVLVTRLRTGHSYSIYKGYLQPQRVNTMERMCVSWYNTVPAMQEVKTETSNEMQEYSEEVKKVYEFLKNSIHYQETILKTNLTCGYFSMEKALELLKQEWLSAQPAELLQALKQLSYNVLTDHREIDSKHYKNILTAIENNINNYNFKDTIELLRFLIILEPRIKDYKNIRAMLNERRYSLLSPKPALKELLLFGDALYQFQMEKTFLMVDVLHKISNKPSRLTPKQIVQFCFLISVSAKTSVHMYEIEYEVEQNLEEIGQKELGIICLGFFRSRNKFRNPEFVQKVLNRLIQNINALDDYTLYAALKIIRYSIKLEAKGAVDALVDLLIPKISSFPIFAITHVSHMITNFGIMNEIAYKAIAKRLMEDIHIARLKDIERIIYGLGQMHECHNDSAVYKHVAYELLASYERKRKYEINRYPLSTGRILTTFAYQNIYMPDLLKCALDPKLVKYACMKVPRCTPYDYWYIYHSLQLDYPEFSGISIHSEMLDYIMQKVEEDFDVHKMHTLQSRMGSLICEIAEYCKDQLLPSAVYVDKLLPHYTIMNVVIGLDKHHNFLNAEEILAAMPKNSFKRVNTDDLKDTKWIAIVPLYNALTASECDFLTGNMLANIRHLQLLGYHTICMSNKTLQALKKDEQPPNKLRDLINKWEAPNLRKIMDTRQIITKEMLKT